MSLPLEAVIACRHVRSIRARRRLSTAVVSASGIATGVAALVIVLSVMNGYATVIRDRLLGVNAHVTVRRAYGEPFDPEMDLVGGLAAVPGVVGVAPYLEAEGFILHRIQGKPLRRAGVLVRGSTEEGIRQATTIEGKIVAGSLDLSEKPEGVSGALIGTRLAEKLGASVGSELHVSTSPAALLLGRVPPLRRYVVTGIYASGYHEFDAGLAVVGLSSLQRDLGRAGVVTGIRLRLENPFRVEEAAPRVRAVVAGHGEGLFASSWIYEQGSLYAWIRMQKWFSTIALSLIVVVAGFNIISVLTMTVIERRREIGILKAMGCPPSRIGRIFTLEGLAVGGAGVLAGDLTGLTLCLVQQVFQVFRLRGDVYLIDALPVLIEPFDVAAVSAGVLGLCTLFTLLPARDAASMDPVDAIRSE